MKKRWTVLFSPAAALILEFLPCGALPARSAPEIQMKENRENGEYCMCCLLSAQLDTLRVEASGDDRSGKPAL